MYKIAIAVLISVVINVFIIAYRMDEQAARIATLETKIAEIDKVVLMNDQLLYVALLGVFELANMPQTDTDILENHFTKRKPLWEGNELD